MKTEYTAAFLFGGIGGGALGFKGARAEYMGANARFRSLCSIDSDPVVCRNYEQITGGKAVQMDLFDRQQYIDFHGVDEPPKGWYEVEPWDLWKAFGEIRTYVWSDVENGMDRARWRQQVQIGCSGSVEGVQAEAIDTS